MKHLLLIAILASCALVVTISLVLLNQSVLTHSNEIASTFPQPNNGTSIQNETHLVLTGCSTDSDGTGKVDVYCPNYDTFHLSRDPPIKASKWTDVQLTVDNGQYTIQYTTPAGTNQYVLANNAADNQVKVFSSASSDIRQNIGNIFPTKTQTSKLSVTKENLYQYALGIVNKDRTDH